jgi:hypothetical protein
MVNYIKVPEGLKPKITTGEQFAGGTVAAASETHGAWVAEGPREA